MIPINIVTIFQLVTMLLFFFGPIKRVLLNPELDFIYLILVILSLRIGFMSVAYKKDIFSRSTWPTRKKEIASSPNDDRKVRLSFDIILVVYFLTSLLMLYSRTGSFLLDFSSFNDLGQVYYSRGESWNVALERIVFILAPVTTMFIPFGMINFAKIKITRKVLFVLALAFRVLVDLVQGVNKSFADIIIFVLIFAIFLICKKSIQDENKTSKMIIRFFIFMIIIGILFAVFLSVFSVNILSRTSYDPNGYSSGTLYFISYLTEGYQAVDYSLTQPFTSTFGLGNSLYLLQAINSNFLLERTYLFKNQVSYGWNWLVNWSTLYVWIANDVSMIGVIPIMFLIGRLFAKTWKQSLFEGNLSSLIVAGLMFQLCIYSSANNQIVQLQSGFVGTWFWLAFWFLFKQLGIRLK